MQILPTEIYKALNHLSSPLMSDLFKIKETKYNIRNRSILVSTNTETTSNAINSITHLGTKIWDLVPEEIKDRKSLNIFKQKIKIWISKKCPYTLCKLSGISGKQLALS